MDSRSRVTISSKHSIPFSFTKPDDQQDSPEACDVDFCPHLNVLSVVLEVHEFSLETFTDGARSRSYNEPSSRFDLIREPLLRFVSTIYTA